MTSSFGSRLKELRKEKRLSQEELGTIIGVAQSTLGSYERETREPSIEGLLQLAHYFEVSVDYLLGNSDLREPATTSHPYGSYDLHQLFHDNEVILYGRSLSEDEKQRLLDISLGLFYR
ncbi:transcriptional regulator [Pradoshia eiseniae]|uniref:Transcriptional regulator n=1 Tax=Pradoshia eiseniae TaxID=2064768 RepID=A0A2S7N1A1_9BACI|nr:helix-turn-helix transcriptional regulator [Pradoshia eiseniae]PQD95777.1 transcriptional regulator [Pradoshia eiseniae]